MEMEPRSPNLCPEQIDSGAPKHFGLGHQTVPIVDAIESRQCLLQFELICTILPDFELHGTILYYFELSGDGSL